MDNNQENNNDQTVLKQQLNEVAAEETKKEIDLKELLSILFAQAQTHMEIHKRNSLMLSAVLQMFIAQRTRNDRDYNRLLQNCILLKKEIDQLIENVPGFKINV